MIIVSQDKDNVINYDNVKSLWIDDNVLDKTNTTFYINADDDFLGEYETEERAKEVLQEIINAYLDCNVQNASAKYAYVKNKVFEMPEE